MMEVHQNNVNETVETTDLKSQQQEADKKVLSVSSVPFVPKTQSQQDADHKALSVSSTPFIPSSVTATTPKTQSQQEADKKALSVASVAFVPKSRSQNAAADDKIHAEPSAAHFDPTWNDPFVHQPTAEQWEQEQLYEQEQMWEEQLWEQQQWDESQRWQQDLHHQQQGHPGMMVTPEHAVAMMSGGYHHPMNMMQGVNGMMITPMSMPGHDMSMMGIPEQAYQAEPVYPPEQMGYPVMGYGTHTTLSHPYTTPSSQSRPPPPPYPHPAMGQPSYAADGRVSSAGSSNHHVATRPDNNNRNYGMSMNNRTGNHDTSNTGRGYPSPADFPQLTSSSSATTASTAASSSKPQDSSWANKIKGADNIINNNYNNNSSNNYNSNNNNSSNNNYNNNSSNNNYNNNNAMRRNANGSGSGPDWREKMWNAPAQPMINNNSNNNKQTGTGNNDGNGTIVAPADSNPTNKTQSSLPNTGANSSAPSSQSTTTPHQSNHHKPPPSPTTTAAKVIVCLNPPKPPAQASSNGQSSSSTAKTSAKASTKSTKAQPVTLPLRPAPTTDAGRAIPQEYLCSLTKQLMTDPVICADGETYEKVVIEKWIQNLEKMNAKLISPVSGNELDHPYLTPNFSIKTLITAFLEK